MNTLGTPTPLQLGDDTYQLSAFTKGIQDQYSQHLVGQAYKAAKMVEGLSDDQYLTLLAKISTQAASNQFKFGGTVYMDALKSLDGQIYLFYLLLKANHASITLEKVKELFLAYTPDFVAALTRILDWYVQALQKKSPVQDT